MFRTCKFIMTNIEQIYNIFKAKYSIDLDNFEDPEISFRQLGIDSMQIISLICEVEKIFNITFTADDMDEIDRLNDLIICIRNKGVEC